jgi:hypothetical protein
MYTQKRDLAQWQGREKERTMSLRNQWDAAQRGRLRAQLRSMSRAFAAGLPAEEAIDGLIMNLCLCRALEFSTEEIHEIFGSRTLAFLGTMAAAAKTERVAPRRALDPAAGLGCLRPPVQTQIGTFGPDGKLRAATNNAGVDDGTIHFLFRRAPGA